MPWKPGGPACISKIPNLHLKQNLICYKLCRLLHTCDLQNRKLNIGKFVRDTEANFMLVICWMQPAEVLDDCSQFPYNPSKITHWKESWLKQNTSHTMASNNIKQLTNCYKCWCFFLGLHFKKCFHFTWKHVFVFQSITIRMWPYMHTHNWTIFCVLYDFCWGAGYQFLSDDHEPLISFCTCSVLCCTT